MHRVISEESFDMDDNIAYEFEPSSSQSPEEEKGSPKNQNNQHNNDPNQKNYQQFGFRRHIA